MSNEPLNFLDVLIPQAPEIEEATLGLLMRKQKLFFNIQNKLEEDCFFKDENRLLFFIIKELKENGQSADVFSIMDAIKRKGLSSKIKSTTIKRLAIEMAIDDSDVEKYAVILKEKSMRRKYIEVAKEMYKNAFDDNDINQLISLAEGKLTNIISVGEDRILTMKQGLEKMLINVGNNASGNKPIGMCTGFSYYDSRAGGLHYSDLVIVAGETSNGKTSLALCIAKNISASGTPAAFYSMEMSTIQLCARLTSAECSVSSSEILYKQVDSYQFNRINEGVAKIENLPFFIDESGVTNIDDILTSIRFLVARYGVKIAFIDYLQLASAKLVGRSKEQETSYMVQRLKNLAKELNICIVALSQLSRHTNPYPTLSRLRDSGQIEQAADVVMFAYRAEKYNNRFPEPFYFKDTKGYALIDIAKGRNIGIFKFLLSFEETTTKFSDVIVDDIPNIEAPPQNKREIDNLVDYTEPKHNQFPY